MIRGYLHVPSDCSLLITRNIKLFNKEIAQNILSSVKSSWLGIPFCDFRKTIGMIGFDVGQTGDSSQFYIRAVEAE